MSAKSVGVAVIGCGRIAGHHCRSIVATQGVHLSAVCDLVEAKAEAYGKAFAVPVFTSYREMFRALPQIQLVVIATPSGMHFEHATEIVRLYRKHVVVEKPTFLRPSQLQDAYRAADEAGLHLFPVFQNRYNLAVQRVRRAIDEGELGPVRIAAVRVRWCRPQRYYDLAPWRGTYAMDGGALTNQGIHHLDLLRFLAGKPIQVAASMRTLGASIEVEDAVVGTVQFESGALGVVEVTTAARPGDFEASLSLVCEKGLAQIGGIAVNELQVFTPDPAACETYSEDFSGNIYGHGHEAFYRDVAACFHKQAPFPIDRQDCLGTLKLLHAFYRADEAQAPADADSEGESSRLGRPDEALAALYRTPHLAGSQR